MNPPFGGEFNKADLANFPDDLKSADSEDMFLARIIYCLKKGGRCGMVVPEGIMFDSKKKALKKKLLEECNLHTVIRMPQSVFNPYTIAATNLLFFEKTGKTKETWFYRLDMPKGRKHFNKTHPIQREDMTCVDEWWNNRVEIKDAKEDESMSETWKAKKYTFEELEALDFSLDLCGYPMEEEIILSPEETVRNYKEHRESLEVKLDDRLERIIKLLGV